MSALEARIAERFRTGHALEDIELQHDSRVSPEARLRPAAVLAAITDGDRPGILLIHRPSNMRAHPGQIALPGGKLDPGETAVEAALREAHEELGIRSEDVRVIGASDSYRTASGYEVTPVIGLVPPDIELHPNPTEVAQWFEAPMDFLFDPANHQRHSGHFNGALHG